MGEDPAKLVNRLDDPRASSIRERLVALMGRFAQQEWDSTFDPIEVSDEERRRLEALGYISEGK